MKGNIKIAIILCILFNSFGITDAQCQTDYFISPVVKGKGDGTSASDAAYYLNSTFWGKVQNNLKSEEVTVWMLDGLYNSGMLSLNYMGNPVHKLTLSAVTEGQVEMWVNSETLYHINMRGTQNTTIRGITFTGDCKNFSIACWASGKKTARNIQIINCRFEHLTNAYYGGLYLANADNILVKGCTFNNVGSGAHAHMIYSDKSSRNLSIEKSSFLNCKGDYVRFRNDTGYAKVDSCTFQSYNYTYNHAFILIPVFNDVNPGDEFLATDFQFTNNTFKYNSVGGRRHAIQFHSDGYNVPESGGLDYWTSVSEGQILNNGSVSEKEAVLNTMGLYRSRVHVYGNTYSMVERQVVFWHHPNYGSTHQGYYNYCDISDWPSTQGEVAAAPVLINGDFEMPGYYLRYWNYPSVSLHAGLNGTGSAVMFDKSAASQELYQWLNNPSEKWTMEALLVVGQHNDSETIFRFDIGHNESDDSRLSLGINKYGEIGIYDQYTFKKLPELGKIEFSVDSDNNNNYLDEGDQLFVYRVRIRGDYSVSNPFTTIELSEANENVFTKKTSNLAYWVNTPPSAGMKPTMISVFSDKCSSIVDEISFFDTDAISSSENIKKKSNILDDQVFVYPNPVVDGKVKIHFRTEMHGTAIVSIYNLTGNLVHVVSLDALLPGLYEKTIDIKHLPESSYLLVFKMKGGIKRTFIIKA